MIATSGGPETLEQIAMKLLVDGDKHVMRHWSSGSGDLSFTELKSAFMIIKEYGSNAKVKQKWPSNDHNYRFSIWLLYKAATLKIVFDLFSEGIHQWWDQFVKFQLHWFVGVWHRVYIAVQRIAFLDKFRLHWSNKGKHLKYRNNNKKTTETYVELPLPTTHIENFMTKTSWVAAINRYFNMAAMGAILKV